MVHTFVGVSCLAQWSMGLGACAECQYMASPWVLICSLNPVCIQQERLS